MTQESARETRKLGERDRRTVHNIGYKLFQRTLVPLVVKPTGFANQDS
jgi:hypothetical protein